VGETDGLKDGMLLGGDDGFVVGFEGFEVVGISDGFTVG